MISYKSQALLRLSHVISYLLSRWSNIAPCRSCSKAKKAVPQPVTANDAIDRLYRRDGGEGEAYRPSGGARARELAGGLRGARGRFGPTPAHAACLLAFPRGLLLLQAIAPAPFTPSHRRPALARDRPFYQLAGLLQPRRARHYVSSPRPPTFGRWVGQPKGLDVQRLRRGDEERKPLREESLQHRHRRRPCCSSILAGETGGILTPQITPVSEKQT
jgi:hypothetical protein